MSHLAPLLLLVPLVVAPACVADWAPPGGDYCPNGCTSTTDPGGSGLTAASDAAPTTTAADDTGAATTAEAPSTSSTSSPDDDTGSTTTADPEDPPSIDDFDLEPIFIDDNGLIDIEVSTRHADGVRMQLESGDVIELTPGQADSFSGAIAVFTGLDNGERVAMLTPYRADRDGEPVPAPYYVALPESGSELDWETGDLIGSSGFVVAMGVLPTGDGSSSAPTMRRASRAASCASATSTALGAPTTSSQSCRPTAPPPT